MARTLQDGCLPRKMPIGASRGQIGGVQGENGVHRSCRRAGQVRVRCFASETKELPLFITHREQPLSENGNANVVLDSCCHHAARGWSDAAWTLPARDAHWCKEGPNRWCAGRKGRGRRVGEEGGQRVGQQANTGQLIIVFQEVTEKQPARMLGIGGDEI